MNAQGSLRDGDRYELLGELASGGMATVYLARMRRPMGFSRLVAIKCMHPQFAKDPSFTSMFMDEARLTARLRHPNIVPTLDIVNEDGHLLLVMEYVEGASLAHVLRAARAANVKIPPAIASAIVHDLLLGLHEAHEARDDDGAPLAIVHRDVSPQNVLVGLDGLARVLDFGVARARQNTHRSNDNEIKGKIPYMPPEQLFGEALDHRVDVYAAGVTLWEALVGERLFDGPSETALVRRISDQPVECPSARNGDLPPELDAIVMRALERSPDARYASALEMAEALARAVSLPTRTEVGAWMKQYVAPRQVPSGDRLAAAAAAVPEEEPATTMLAILERASLLRPASKRGEVMVLDAAAPPPPRRRWALAVAALAVVLGGVGVANVAIARGIAASSPPVPVATVDAPAAAPAAVPESAAEAAPESAPEESAAPAPEPAAVRAPPPARTARAAPKAAPATKDAKDAPASANEAKDAPAAAPAPATKPGCNIPYTIDSAGHKHYKVECI